MDGRVINPTTMSHILSNQPVHPNLLMIASTKSDRGWFFLLTLINGIMLDFSFLILSRQIPRRDLWVSIFLVLILGAIIALGQRRFVPESKLVLLLVFSILLSSISALSLTLRDQLETSILVLILSLVFSFFLVALRLSAQETCYFIDALTEELVITSHSVFFGGIVERRVQRTTLKAATIRTQINIETISGEKILIPNSHFMPDRNPVRLAALCLVKHLRLPISLEDRSFPEDKRGTMFTPEMQQQREVFIPTPQEVPQLEPSVQKVGWRKISEVPFLLQKKLSILDLFVIISLFFGLPVFCVLITDYTMMSELFQFLYRLFPLMVGFSLIYGLSWRDFIRMDETGLLIGLKMLGIPIRGVCWPYEFIKTLKVNEIKFAFQIYFQVVIDFFLGEERIAAFKSKAVAEQFRAYLNHVSSIYENQNTRVKNSPCLDL